VSRRALLVALAAAFVLAAPGAATAQLTEHVTPGGSGSVSGAAMSADGRFVAFATTAPLVAGDTNGIRDIYVRDRVLGTTERVSLTSAGAQVTDLASEEPSISADGRYVAFVSESAQFIPGDGDGQPDVFVFDRQNDGLDHASDGLTGTGSSGAAEPEISADGRSVVFTAVFNAAENIRVFVKDLDLETTTPASVASDGVSQPDQDSLSPSISQDGRYVAFTSGATSLVAGHTGTFSDVFVRDLQLATTTLVSVATTGNPGNDHSFSPAISSDGAYVVFNSGASDLTMDPPPAGGVYLRDLGGASTEKISVDAMGGAPDGSSEGHSVSADGRFVVWTSLATDIVPGDLNGHGDVFLWDAQTDSSELVSVATDGSQGNGLSGEVAGHPTVSTDGRFVIFLASGATNLAPGGAGLLVRDRADVRALTVNKAGTGSGTVTSTPAGINCGSTCIASFPLNGSVTLTATPAAGSTFTSWSGCDSMTGNECTVAMTNARTVTPTFTANPVTNPPTGTPPTQTTPPASATPPAKKKKKKKKKKKRKK
jgi:Tol biopolymer transport system component